MQKTKTKPIHIIKRSDIKAWQAWLIRIGIFAVALLVCGIVSVIVKPGSFGKFFKYLFLGNIGTKNRFLSMLQDMALLLCVAMALTPAFKMRFWNIGGEGQILLGCLMCMLCIYYAGGSMPNWAVVIVCFIASVVAGAVWALIPALFKAKWNTNETLFTLMMNYVAIQLVKFCVTKWAPGGSNSMGTWAAGSIPVIGNTSELFNILIIAVLTILLAVYLRFSKHGYELTVVGESINTARYIGINIKKVIVRTMLLSGAICGFCGFLLVSGKSHTLNENLSNNMGFTAILISWLGHFNPLGMALTAFIYAFLSKGAKFAGDQFRLGDSFNAVITGIFFFFIIASEFFINYKVVFNFKFLKRKQQALVTEGVSVAGAASDSVQNEETANENEIADNTNNNSESVEKEAE